MNAIRWEDIGSFDPISAGSESGIGWVLEYKHANGAVWHWPVYRFVKQVLANTRMKSLEVSLRPVPALCDGCDCDAVDPGFEEYPVSNVGDFSFNGVKYVGEAAYIAAYETYVSAWPKGEQQ